jgi:hypothetical protein
LYGYRENRAARYADAGIYVLGTGGGVVLRSALLDGRPEASVQVHPQVGRQQAILSTTPAGSSLTFYDEGGNVSRSVP